MEEIIKGYSKEDFEDASLVLTTLSSAFCCRTEREVLQMAIDVFDRIVDKLEEI